MEKYTVLEAYKKMTNILQQYFNDNLDGKDFENMFDNLLFTLAIDEKKTNGESRDQMCYHNFKIYCSLGRNKSVTNNTKITMNKAYDGMMYVLNDYIKPWDDMEDKRYLAKHFEIIKNKKNEHI